MYAVVITVSADDYGDTVVNDLVYATSDIKVISRYEREGLTNEHTVSVNPEKVKQLLGPVELAFMETKDLLIYNFPGNIQTELKQRARERLMADGENPNEWGLSVDVKPYKIVCMGKYSGKEA